MLNAFTKALILDNNEDHLNKLDNALKNLRIASIAELYNPTTLPALPYEGIKLAFFDIQLEGGPPPDTQLLNTITNALKSYISINNGPFILIFYTNHKDKIEQIKEYINKRESENIAFPILIDCIDKSIALGDNSEDLKKVLEGLLKNDIIHILLDFESQVIRAAEYSLNTIFKVISEGDKWGENKNFISNFDKVFLVFFKSMFCPKY